MAFDFEEQLDLLNALSYQSLIQVSALNRKIDVVSLPWIGLLLFKYPFEALVECNFILEVL